MNIAQFIAHNGGWAFDRAVRKSAFAALSLIAGVLLMPQASFAQNAEGIEVLDAGAVEEPISEVAQKLAALQYPLADVLQSARTKTTNAFRIAIQADPDYQQKRKYAPGLDSAIERAMLGTVNRVTQQRHPELIDNMAIMLDRNFSAEELNALTEFHKSPLGQRFTKAMIAAPDMATLRKMLRATQGDEAKEAAALHSKMQFDKAMGSLAPDDKIAMGRWFSSALGIKVTNLMSEETRIAANWTVSIDDQMLREGMDDIMIAVANYANK